jgi:hypothetical protein
LPPAIVNADGPAPTLFNASQQDSDAPWCEPGRRRTLSLRPFRTARFLNSAGETLVDIDEALKALNETTGLIEPYHVAIFYALR